MGPAANVAYLNSTLPHEWLTMPNPVPVTGPSVDRGRVIYNAYCVGCHGSFGDGRGDAKPFLNPPPMDFTLLQATGANPQMSVPKYPYKYKLNHVSALNNGAIYFAVLYGLPGSAMPQFKGQLESEKIWDVGNYIGWAYMGWKLQPISGKYDELARANRPEALSPNPFPIGIGKGRNALRVTGGDACPTHSSLPVAGGVARDEPG